MYRVGSIQTGNRGRERKKREETDRGQTLTERGDRHGADTDERGDRQGVDIDTQRGDRQGVDPDRDSVE